MKATVSPEVENAIADIARRHGLSREAVLAMLRALHVGGGTMAQFSIPELGGSGQWMQGGMTMVGGNLFDNALKARVDALCSELAQLLATTAVFPSPRPTGWPANVAGSAFRARSGGRTTVRYAIFPSTRRLAIQIDGVTKVFDTGDHQSVACNNSRAAVACNNSSRAAVACNNSSRRRIRLGDLHQPVRHLRRIEPG